MPIPQHIIDAIQEKTDIVEVISQYVALKKAGRNYKAACPFHQEKTPSFNVNQDKQIFRCFGCGVGGNVFTFIMKHENVEFPEAVEMLAEKAGIAMPRYAPGDPAKASEAAALLKAQEGACEFFQQALAANKSAREYLRSRGVSEESEKAFRLGFAPYSWEGLLGHMKRKGFDAPLVEKAGLAVDNEKGGYYDRFRNRITFPIIDAKNRILGFGARVLDASLPKYINSPETPIYQKGKHLYGLNWSRDYIRKEGFVLIVEGYLDFLIPYQAGVRNLIATLGTALTKDQVKMLKRQAPTAIMVYDPDEAGEAASLRNMDIFLAEDMNVYVAELPTGFDPDSCIQKLGTAEFMRIIKGAKNLFDYKLAKLMARHNVQYAHGRAAIATEMLPTLAKIGNAVLRSELMKRLTDRLGVDEAAVREEMRKIEDDARHHRPSQPESVEPKRSRMGAEEQILAVLVDDGSFIERARSEVDLNEFRNEDIRNVVKSVFDLFEEKGEVNATRLMSYLGNDERASIVISEAVQAAEIIGERKEKVLSDCIATIRKKSLQEMLDKLRAEQKDAQDAGHQAVAIQLGSEIDGIIRKLHGGQRTAGEQRTTTT